MKDNRMSEEILKEMNRRKPVQIAYNNKPVFNPLAYYDLFIKYPDYYECRKKNIIG